MPRSKKPRKKYHRRDPAQALYSALLFAGLSKTEAEIIARDATKPRFLKPKHVQRDDAATDE